MGCIPPQWRKMAIWFEITVKPSTMSVGIFHRNGPLSLPQRTTVLTRCYSVRSRIEPRANDWHHPDRAVREIILPTPSAWSASATRVACRASQACWTRPRPKRFSTA